MLNIRKYIFETNSSSGDYYSDDCRDGDPLPSTTRSTADIQITLHWKDGVSEERKKEIFKLIGDYDVSYEITEAIENEYNAFEELEISKFIDNTTLVLHGTVFLACENWDPGYKGDRYCPPEGPSCEYAPDGDAIVDDFDKNFKNVTINELLSILRPLARKSDKELAELLSKLYAEGKVDYEDVSYYEYDEEIPGYIDEIGDTFEVYVSIDEDRAYDNMW